MACLSTNRLYYHKEGARQVSRKCRLDPLKIFLRGPQTLGNSGNYNFISLSDMFRIPVLVVKGASTQNWRRSLG